METLSRVPQATAVALRTYARNALDFALPVRYLRSNSFPGLIEDINLKTLLFLCATAVLCPAQNVPDVARLLADVIKIDTSNPPGNEGALAEFLKSRLVPLGFEIDIIPTPQAGKAHLIARLRGDGSKRPVLIAAHEDVVGVEREKWSVDPFAGVIKDGYVWGRGAIDFKGGMAVFLQAVAGLVAFQTTRSRVLAMGVAPPPPQTPAPAGPAPRLPGGWLAYLAPLLLFVCTAVYLNQNWDRLPERFPVHWDASGNANRWTTKTPKSVFGILGFGILLQGLFLFLAYAMKNGARFYAPESSRTRFLEANLWLMLFVQWFTALLFVYIALLPLQVFSSGKWFILGLTGTLTAVIIGFVIHMTKLQAEPSEPDETPNECWKWGGLVYYNPADPALMVEKRFGLGYTINFGRGMAWIFLALLLAIMILPIYLFQ